MLIAVDDMEMDNRMEQSGPPMGKAPCSLAYDQSAGFDNRNHLASGIVHTSRMVGSRMGQIGSGVVWLEEGDHCVD